MRRMKRRNIINHENKEEFVFAHSPEEIKICLDCTKSRCKGECEHYKAERNRIKSLKGK